MGRALTLVLMLIAPSVYADAAPRRVIFDQHFHWLTRAGADAALQRIRTAGFNVFVPCVWIGRGTTWPSALAPAAPEWRNVRAHEPDPLAYLIERAHALGIEVHPWFTVSYRTREFLPGLYDAGTPAQAFDIHRAAFRDFFVALVAEVAARYPVDGINLDYVRSQGVCVSPSCVDDYRERFRRDVMQDRAAADARPDALRRYPKAWETLSAWNRAVLAGLVRAISAEVRRVRPAAVLSVDTIAEIREFRVQGADAVTWANEGWVDVIYHMDYGQQLDAGPIDAARRRLARPEQLVVLISTADWPGHRQGAPGAFSRDPAVLTRQIGQLRERWHQSAIALWTLRFLSDAQFAAWSRAPGV